MPGLVHDRGFERDCAAIAAGEQVTQQCREVDTPLAGVENWAQTGEITVSAVAQVADVNMGQPVSDEPWRGGERIKLPVEGGKPGVKNKSLVGEGGVDGGQIGDRVGSGTRHILNQDLEAEPQCAAAQAFQIIEVARKMCVGIKPAPEVQHNLPCADPRAHFAALLPKPQCLPAESQSLAGLVYPGAEHGSHLLVSVDDRETQPGCGKFTGYLRQLVKVGGEHHQFKSIERHIGAERRHHPENVAVIIAVDPADDGTGRTVERNM